MDYIQLIEDFARLWVKSMISVIVLFFICMFVLSVLKEVHLA